MHNGESDFLFFFKKYRYTLKSLKLEVMRYEDFIEKEKLSSDAPEEMIHIIEHLELLESLSLNQTEFWRLTNGGWSIKD